MAEVIVDDLDIQNALINGLASNKELKRKALKFVDATADTWREVWDTSLEGVKAMETGEPHPYETGDYREHIKKKKIEFISEKTIRQAFTDGAVLGSVYNDSEHAEWIENGTKADSRPGSTWGPNTPTPAFKCAERTADIMRQGFSVE